jgi:Fe2+ or Zn2+ uptake regulation protein
MAAITTHTETTLRVQDHLVGRGVRYTAARRLVVLALGEATGPRSAADLHDDLGREVPLSSLYRTLAVLEDAGVLVKEHDTGGIARYELAEWLTGHHHHLVCIACGLVVDVDIPAPLEERLGGIVEEIAGRAGFQATGHRIDIEGRCPSCDGR